MQPLESPLTDWKDVADRINQVPGIRLAAPVVDGQALASSPFNAAGVLVRGIRADDLNNLTSIAKNIKQGSLEGFDSGQGVAIGRRLADLLSLHAGDTITLVAPKGAVTVDGHHAARSNPTRSPPCSRSACRNMTRPSCSCRCRRRRPISTATTT